VILYNNTYCSRLRNVAPEQPRKDKNKSVFTLTSDTLINAPKQGFRTNLVPSEMALFTSY